MVEIGCESFEKDKKCDAEDWIIMNVYSIFQLYCEGEKAWNNEDTTACFMWHNAVNTANNTQKKIGYSSRM